MNIQNTASVIKTVEAYMTFDTEVFSKFCERYLELRKRKTFDLKVQNGLMTLIELHSDIPTLSAFLISHLTPLARKKIPFDAEVRHLLERLDGLQDITSLDSIPAENQSMESVRKMFLALSRDFRVVLILMALRYSELFDLDQMSPSLRKRIARQTLEIFVPILGRLGIYTLKRKLEDRCFSFLFPEEYSTLEKAFDERPELSEDSITRLVKVMNEFFESRGILARVTGRVKGRYSTYMKLKQKGGGTPDEIYDLLALRVMVERQEDCYHVLSLINHHWLPVPGRFKDYIAMPKVNGYRSLHTAVKGIIQEFPRPVEIQIRTFEMHREAEFGIAAHWWYQEENIKSGKKAEHFVGRGTYEEKLQWVKNLVHLQDTLFGTPSKKTEFEIFSDRIFVMTLTGVVIELPKGATPLDFAYAISESLGHHCFQVRVNDRIVPLSYQLKNGDRVFVVKRMEATPSLYWLSLVQTEKAKSAIRQWFLDEGQSSVPRRMRIVHRAALPKAELLEQEKPLSSVRQKPLIIVDGERNFKTKVAACCHPEMRDTIVGYVTRGGFISIHRKDCKVMQSLDEKRLIESWWG